MPDMRFDFYEYPRPNVLQIVDDWARIDFDPDYQRKGGLWNLENRQYFIDSILNGVSLTKLYFHELPPGKSQAQAVTYGVVDGKQRLEAIRSFVRDEFPLSDEFEYLHGDGGQAAGKTYSELLTEFPELRARFDDTDLPVTVIRAEDEVLIEVLFVRLNEQVNLNAAEKRNAFGGPIPLKIRELAKHRLFADSVPFPDGRYRHRELAAKFLWIIHEDKFVSTKRRDLDNFVKEYRLDPKRSPCPTELLKVAREVADEMALFFEPDDRLLQNVGWITLFFHLFRIARSHPLPSGLRRAHFEEFIKKVTETRHLIRRIADGEAAPSDPAPSPDLAQFDSLRQSPNDATALRTRYSILCRYFTKVHQIQLPEEDDEGD